MEAAYQKVAARRAQQRPDAPRLSRSSYVRNRLLKTGQCDSPSRPNLGDKAEETGDSPLQEPLLVVEGGFHPHTPPQGRARHLTFDIGGALLEPSAATHNFTAFSRSVELELLGKTQGRGACKAVVLAILLSTGRSYVMTVMLPGGMSGQLPFSPKLGDWCEASSLHNLSCSTSPSSTSRKRSKLTPPPRTGLLHWG